MKTLLLSALTATAFALPVALPTAASAGSQISISFTPSNARDAQLLRLGLAAYALHENIDANGHVTQSGARNAAAIAQGGPDNRAILRQEGTDHSGSITQTGGNNAYGLFQYGTGTSAHAYQNGGQSGLTFVYGW